MGGRPILRPCELALSVEDYLAAKDGHIAANVLLDRFRFDGEDVMR